MGKRNEPIPVLRMRLRSCRCSAVCGEIPKKAEGLPAVVVASPEEDDSAAPTNSSPPRNKQMMKRRLITRLLPRGDGRSR